MAREKATLPPAETVPLKRWWDVHWEKRRARDPRSKADASRYSSALELLPAPARNLLDVGGGDATFAFLARERFSHLAITVLDRSPAAILTARARGFRACTADVDGPGLPFGTRTFDVVICLNVLQDILHPWPLLSELVRVSRRWVIVGCPNFASLANRWDLLRGQVPRQIRKSHLRFITFCDVRTRLEGLGLRVVSYRTKIKLPVLASLPPATKLPKAGLAHRLFPNLASHFTILAEQRGRED